MPLCTEKTFLHDYLYSLEVCQSCERVVSFPPNAIRCFACMQALDLVWKARVQCCEDQNGEGEDTLNRVWQRLFKPLTPKNNLTPPL